MCKPQYGSLLAFGVCKVSHISNHIYAKNPLNNILCQNIKLNGRCEHKDHFCMNIQKKLTFTKINIFDVHAKFALKWQTLIGVNTLT